MRRLDAEARAARSAPAPANPTRPAFLVDTQTRKGDQPGTEFIPEFGIPAENKNLPEQE